MNPVYDRLYATATRLLKAYGQPMTLRKKQPGSAGHDPRTGVVTPPAPPVDEMRMGIESDSPGTRIGQQYGENFKTASMVKSTEKWVYIDANGSRPALEDQLIMQGHTHTVLDVQDIGPGGKNLLYLLVLKR